MDEQIKQLITLAGKMQELMADNLLSITVSKYGEVNILASVKPEFITDYSLEIFNDKYYCESKVADNCIVTWFEEMTR